ncbi:MAG: hypothetical protein IIA14_12200 [SAR324 cluster bacterium]|nr:hypothetical protein [SAR324 cluster bacterium]
MAALEELARPAYDTDELEQDKAYVCDLSAEGAKSWAKDKNLKIKMDLAEEYRQRLSELKQELDAHQKKGKAVRK